MSTLLNFNLPKFGETLRGVKTALNAEYREYGLDAFQPNNLLYPLGIVIAHVMQQVFNVARVQASEATPFGATGSNLDAWLDFYGVTVPEAQRATGHVQVTGGNGRELPAGTLLTRLDGAVFVTTAGVTFGPEQETVTVAVEAQEIGTFSNTAVGEELDLSVFDDDLNPIAISTGITNGSDPADDVAKRALAKTRLAQSAIAGSPKDYELRSLAFSASIERVFVEPAGLGVGTVVVFPLNRNSSTAEYWEVTIPTDGELSALQDHLSRDDVARINDRVMVVALTVRSVPLTVALTPNTAAAREHVLGSLRQRFHAADAAGGYTIPNSEISGAISAADGEISHELVDVGGLGPKSDAVAEFGELVQVGEVTFIEQEAQ